MGSSLLLKGGTSNPRKLVESISTTSPHGFSVGDVVRFETATSLWTKAQANSAENSEVAGVVSAITTTTEFEVTYSGYIEITSLAGVTSPVLFLDSTAAGGLTASPPSAIGMVVKPVLTKTTNGSGYIVSNYIGTQIGGSSTVAIDEIQPVGTIMPFAGSVIPDSWLACDGNSYAISSYPNLYAKLQNSSGDRAPAYGHVVTLTLTLNGTSIVAGDFIEYKTNTGAWTGTLYDSNADLVAQVLSVSTAGSVVTAVVQVIPVYSKSTKNFKINNVVFSSGGLLASGSETGSGNYRAYTSAKVFKGTNLTFFSSAITHFNTPDLRGRFALGLNTTAIGEVDGDIANDANYSAISGIYSLGSEGGQEFVAAPSVKATPNPSGSDNAAANFTDTKIANMPPYTVVRYIIKASPYTRAAIIDGIDIPYTSLLVGDLRDGSLRPGGSGEDLLFKTNNGTSGTERMRLTNAGNLGIGTTTPVYKLVVSNSGAEGFEFIPANTSGVNIIQSYNRSGAVYNTLDFRASDYKVRVGNTEQITINSSGQVNIASAATSTSVTTGGLTLGGGLGVGGAIYATTINATATTPSTSVGSGALVVAGGLGVALGINTTGITATSVNTTGLSKLSRTSVFNGSSDLNSNYVLAAKATASDNGAVIGYANNNTVYGILGHADAYSLYGAGAIYTSGDITAFSDIRSKENISTIENALDKTLTLNGVLYTDKETQQRRTGLIAQDVLSVLPEAVRTNTDGYYALAYGNLVGLLVQSIKELNAKVDALSEKVNSLGGTA
jgi:microcystin-dependent protein